MGTTKIIPPIENSLETTYRKKITLNPNSPLMQKKKDFSLKYNSYKIRKKSLLWMYLYFCKCCKTYPPSFFCFQRISALCMIIKKKITSKLQKKNISSLFTTTMRCCSNPHFSMNFL